MMYSILKALAISSLALSCMGALTGNQKISTHHYDTIIQSLDTNPVSCGVFGRDLDINMITAVQGLTKDQCGTCLKVVAGGKSVYVMALDTGGVGLDLNKSSFVELFGIDTGLFEAKWEPTDQSNCKGAIKSGNYDFPALKSTPITKPIEDVTNPTKKPDAPEYPKVPSTAPEYPKVPSTAPEYPKVPSTAPEYPKAPGTASNPQNMIEGNARPTKPKNIDSKDGVRSFDPKGYNPREVANPKRFNPQQYLTQQGSCDSCVQMHW